MEEKKYLGYISFSAVICAIAVVFLHTNKCFWKFSTDPYWISANTIECIFHFAVPAFFMITGVTLLDFNKRYGLKEYFKKRINKTLIPFLFWSMFGLLYQAVYLCTIPIKNINAHYIINKLISGRMVAVYWFFIPLFCVYLIIPALANIKEEKKIKLK